MRTTNLRNCASMLLSLLFFTLASCEKVDLAQEEKKSADEIDEETTTYTVQDIVQRTYSQDHTDNIYLEGYIVGYIDGSNIYQADFDCGTNESNILLADSPTEEDPTLCVPVQLSTSTNSCRQTREAINLADHPDLLHQHVRICGNIGSYMGTKGLLNAHTHTLLPNNEEEEPDTPEELKEQEESGEPDENDKTNTHNGSENPVPPQNPDETDDTGKLAPTLKDSLDYVWNGGNSVETAFSVTDFETYIPTFFENIRDELNQSLKRLSECYVRGYIVGFISNGRSLRKTFFGVNNAVETNIVIANSPDETDYNRCIAVQLSTGSQKQKKVRETLNLADHPENLGAAIVVLGDIELYMGAYGVINTDDVTFTP